MRLQITLHIIGAAARACQDLVLLDLMLQEGMEALDRWAKGEGVQQEGGEQ